MEGRVLRLGCVVEPPSSMYGIGFDSSTPERTRRSFFSESRGLKISGTDRFLIGSHTSISGGYFRAADIAGGLGLKTVQIFSKNNNQWRGKEISSEDCDRFAASLKAHQLVHPISHASYLINLASPKEDLWSKSVDALVDELERADRLGLEGVVMHPGSATDGDSPAGIDRISKGIVQALERTSSSQCRILLENTAGQGTALGADLSEIAEIIAKSGGDDRLGVCLDSCHAHAAGYDLSEEDGVDRLVAELERLALMQRVKAIHLNDSKKMAGSRVDRHEHLGIGTIGEAGLARFINHPQLRSLPMYLETEKGTNEEGEDWDAVNSARARSWWKPLP